MNAIFDLLRLRFSQQAGRRGTDTHLPRHETANRTPALPQERLARRLPYVAERETPLGRWAKRL